MAADDAPTAKRSLAQQPLLLAVALLVLLTGTALLLGAASGGSSPTGSGQLEGIVGSAEQGAVVFIPEKPFEGRREVRLEVRPRDAPAVDVQHLQQHSAQGLRTRLFFERDAGKLYAVGQEDLPGTPSPGGVP